MFTSRGVVPASTRPCAPFFLASSPRGLTFRQPTDHGREKQIGEVTLALDIAAIPEADHVYRRKEVDRSTSSFPAQVVAVIRYQALVDWKLAGLFQDLVDL